MHRLLAIPILLLLESPHPTVRAQDQPSDPDQCHWVWIQCDKYEVVEGETVTIRAIVMPSSVRTKDYTYTWTTSDGKLSIDTRTAMLDTTGLANRTVTVGVSVDSLRNGCMGHIEIPIIVEELFISGDYEHFPDLYFEKGESRLDDRLKAISDSVALRLLADPSLSVRIDAHSSADEASSLSTERAVRVRDYFVETKQIDPGRVYMVSFGNSCPKGDVEIHRRVEFYLLPDGSSPKDVVIDCTPAGEESRTP